MECKFFVINKTPKYYFIVNPVSGRGKGAGLGKRLEKRLTETELDYKIVYTTEPGHAEELANSAAKEFDIIVAVGGDGTLNEVINGMHGSGKIAAIIPVGTGNDFIRALKIPLDFDEAFALLLRNRHKKIDIGKANGRLFHNGLGIGFDAHVVEKGLRVKYLRGNAFYLYSVLTTLFSYKPVDIELAADGYKRKMDYFMVTAANGVSLGGGFYLTPDALQDDGLFDLCLIQNMPIFSILKNLLKVYSGTHKYDPRVDIIRAKKVVLKSAQGFAAHMDGELISMNIKEMNIEILEKSLEFIS
jgi:YegS/Rv2252/BmrU family lipid kinase